MDNKNYKIILISILFAILLWFLINMNYEYVTTDEVQINLINNNKIALKQPIPDFFKAKIKGRGWDILSFQLTSNPEFNLDLTNARFGTWRLIKKDILEGISLSQNLIALDASIDSINIYTDKYDSIKLPVKLNAEIKFKEGYASIGEYEIKPDSIWIKGAKSIIDTLKYWPTKNIHIKDISEPIKLKIPLADMPKYVLESNINEVETNIAVEPFADKTLSGINIIINALPTNKEVVLIPPKADIIVRGNISLLTDFSSENVQAYIEYNDLLNDSTGYIQPKFSIPEGLKIIKTNPEKFQYIIRKRLM